MRAGTYVLIVATAAAVATGGAAAANPAQSPNVTATVAAEIAKLGRGVEDVALVDDTGAQVRWRDLNGQPRAVFFGFTHCPVICPVTVWELDAALAQAGPAADRIKVNFVSLDPARDTPAALHSYFSGFKGRVVGVSGSDAGTKRLAKAFDVTFQKVGLSKGDYTLDHTAAVYLLNDKGQVVDLLGYGMPRAEMVSRLKRLASPAS